MQLIIRLLLFLVFFATGMAIVLAQPDQNHRNDGTKFVLNATLGFNSINTRRPNVLVPPIRDYGEASPGISAGLMVNRKATVLSKLVGEIGLGVKYTQFDINNEKIFISSPLPLNDNSKERNTYLRYLNIHLPLSIGKWIFNEEFYFSFGGFASYRFADFSHSDENLIEYFGSVTIINPDGSSMNVIAPFPTPRTTSTRREDLPLPAKNLQFGITAKLLYNMPFNIINKPLHIGLDINRFLSNNEIWFGSELKWNIELSANIML